MIFFDILFALGLNGIQKLRVIFFSEPGVILNQSQIYSVFVQEDLGLFFFPVLSVLVVCSLGLFRVDSLNLKWREKVPGFEGRP
jgi:hypothetical protein